MRLLVDQNLARRVAAALRDAGHDAVHVAERGLSAADDREVLAVAVEEQRVIVSEDTDFGALLAHAGAAAPSFVLLRAAAEPLSPERQATLLIANLPAVEDELAAGCHRRVLTRPDPGASPADRAVGVRRRSGLLVPSVRSCDGKFRTVRTREGHAEVMSVGHRSASRGNPCPDQVFC